MSTMLIESQLSKAQNESGSPTVQMVTKQIIRYRVRDRVVIYVPNETIRAVSFESIKESTDVDIKPVILFCVHSRLALRNGAVK